MKRNHVSEPTPLEKFSRQGWDYQLLFMVLSFMLCLVIGMAIYMEVAT